MRQWSLWGSLVCFVVFSSFAANQAALDEVLKLKKAGLDPETIVAFIQSRNENYNLSADDAISLKQQGFDSKVLSALLSSGGGNPPPAITVQSTPAPSALPAVASAPPTVITTNAVLAPGVASSPQLAAPPQSVVVQAGVVAVPAGLSADAAYFYQELSPYGRWLLLEDGSWYWQPTVAISNRSWRPYWDHGYWVNTDSGWYWTSDYKWGWAPFHYGRWSLHPLHGWLWVPDRVWSPAWVTWRVADDYCGWAPLPPGARFDLSANVFLFNGRRVSVDFDFGLSWRHFAFFPSAKSAAIRHICL